MTAKSVTIRDRWAFNRIADEKIIITYSKLSCKLGPPAEKVMILKQTTSTIKTKMSCFVTCNGMSLSMKS
jgi:hypothetical protein